MSLPLVTIEFPDPVYDSLVPFLCSMPHIESSYIHSLLSKGLQHLRGTAPRPNGANNFGAPRTPEAC